VVNRMNRGNMLASSCPAMNGNAGNIHSTASSSKSMLLKKLQKVDFSLVDTVLYLDAYPHCKKALDYYHKLLAERENLIVKLNEAGVTLNNMSNTSDTWEWTDSPWPWEFEAN